MSNIFDRVKQELNILDVVERYVKVDLTRDGDNRMKGLCPFHSEKTGSFKVYVQTDSFRCFGCKKGGSVIDVVMYKNGVDALEAAKILAEDYDIKVEPLTEEQANRHEIKKQRLSAMVDYIDWAHKNLTKKHRETLHRRGVPDKMIDELKIGFDPRSRNFEKVVLGDFNLMGASGNYLPSERIVIPIYRYDNPEYLVFWKPDAKQPKYLYPSGVARPLVGADILGREKSAYLVEGIFDYLSMLMLDYPVVCSLGNDVSDKQGKALDRAKRIYILYDGDGPGREGAERVALKHFPKTRIVNLPDGKDPNDLAIDPNLTVRDFELKIKEAVSKSTDSLQLSLVGLQTENEWEKQQYISDKIIPLTLKLDQTARRIWFDKNKKEFGMTAATFHSLHLTNNDDQSAEERSEFETSANFPELVDLVDDSGSVSFLIKGDQKYHIASHFDSAEKTYVAPDKDRLPWGKLPDAKKVLEHIRNSRTLGESKSDELLFDKIVAHHKGVSQLQKEEHYWLLAAWTMLTYTIEATEYFPILCFSGTHERGKSRTGKGIIYLSYRGILVDTFRETNIIRQATDLRAALFIDVMDLWKKATQSGCEDLLLSRFERGAVVPRVLYPERGAINDTVYYNVYGPTVIATNVDIHEILESRALPIQMPITEKIFDLNVKPEPLLPLKEELVAFRARHMEREFPDTPKLINGRLGDIFKPLHQLVKMVKPSIESNFSKLIHDFEKVRKEEISISFEGQIVSTILSLESHVEKGRLPLSMIREKFNESRTEGHQITSQALGRKIKSIGLETGKTSNGCSTLIWDQKKNELLKLRYGLAGLTGVTGVPSDTTPNENYFPVVDNDGNEKDVREVLNQSKLH